MRLFVGRLAAVAVLATAAFATLAVPAQASPASGAVVTAPATKCPKPTACPLSEIQLKLGKAVYVPATLSGHLTVGTCTNTNYSFAVFNATKVSEQVTFLGKPFGAPIPGKSGTLLHGIVICATSKGTGTFGIKSNAKAALKVTIS